MENRQHHRPVDGDGQSIRGTGMERYAHIVGWGKYLPAKVMTNEDLARSVDTSDGWIRDRTGIGQRYIAGKETTASMALYAAQEALEVADVNPAELDLVIVATATPEHPFPATACLVQNALGAENAGAFDLEAGCSGFVYGLAVAAGMIRSGMYNTILVVGSETLSKVVDWKDRATCVLFGDGAGAVVLRSSPEYGGILSTVLGSDGSGGELLQLPAGGSKYPASLETVTSNMHTIKMNGREVYRFATRVMADAAKQVVSRANIPIEEIDLLIPHQANVRIIDYAAKALKLPPEKVFINLERYGNTSAASIPIALTEAIDAKRVKQGDNLVFVGFGAGLTWAACAVQWTIPTIARKYPPQHVAQSRLRYGWATVKSMGTRAFRHVDSGVSRVLDRIEGRKEDI
jgi:3-oxoacyl-[acyl-carrier-protein] synthase III